MRDCCCWYADLFDIFREGNSGWGGDGFFLDGPWHNRRWNDGLIELGITDDAEAARLGFLFDGGLGESATHCWWYEASDERDTKNDTDYVKVLWKLDLQLTSHRCCSLFALCDGDISQ